MTSGVLQLGPWPPPQGGVQTHMVALRRFLRERGVDCGVINLTRFRHAAADGVFYPASALGVARLLVRLPHRIVHLHVGGMVSHRLLGLGLFCSLLPDRRTVLTFHSGGFPTSAAGLRSRRRSLRALLLRRFDRIIAVNAAIAELMRRLGVDADRVHVISPFSLDGPAAPADVPDRLRAFCAMHRPLLVTVGLLEPEYDLPLQIETLGRVREQFPKAGLVILGSGSLENRLRAAIQARPWADDVLLYGDAPHALALRAIADADVLLRTTWFDGDAISVREALQLGTPVVASDNGMRPDGVELVPPRDGRALLEAITRRLQNAAPPARRPSGGDENLKAVLDLYAGLGRR